MGLCEGQGGLTSDRGSIVWVRGPGFHPEVSPEEPQSGWGSKTILSWDFRSPDPSLDPPRGR